MITLYTFGPAFGLPDPSPFVTKAEVLLKLAGLTYETDTTGFGRAPKGKLPYIRDGEIVIADSTLIRLHLERRHRIDFDIGLSRAERATAWAFEKMAEDQIYWAAMRERWLDDANFDRGPRRFFDPAPAPVRPFVIAKVRRDVRKALHAQGLGRHSVDEMMQIVTRAIDAVADFLGEKPWLLGEVPCGADASVWSVVTGVLCPHFDAPSRSYAATKPNLVAYRDRGMKRWFPAIASASAKGTAA